MNRNQTDQELLAVLRTDRLAFEVFYRRHVGRVIRFAARRLSEPADVADLTAATFVEALTSAPSFDGSRGEPEGWLLGIAARLIANGQRRRGREAAALRRIASRRLIEPDDFERLEEQIDASRATASTLAVISALKPRDREALFLVGAEGLTPSQAAAALGISGPAFRMRLRTARRALARALDSSDEACAVPSSDLTEVTL